MKKNSKIKDRGKGENSDDEIVYCRRTSVLWKEYNSKTDSGFIRKIREKVCFFDEGSGKHPADYEYHAYITDEQLKELEETTQVKIKQCATENKEGYIVALSEFTKMEQQQLLAYKIYDFLPWETEKTIDA